MADPAFEQVEKLFHDALAVPAPERPSFLDAACGANTELRAAVLELLRHAGEPTDEFLVSPVAEASALLRTGGAAQTVRTTAPAPAAPGRLDIPGYEILAEVGRGGMGIVCKARQINLNRIVALKMMLPGSASPEILARFRAEADALARLHHPNIVTIYDIGEYQGRPYFTMEFVAGLSLARLLDGRPQDVTASARLIEMLARIVFAVHQHGILHRDLKPANILLQEDLTQSRKDAKEEDESKDQGTQPPSALLSSFASLRLGVRSSLVPKITDFGLAKDQTAGSKLTQTGMVLGTPCYMAPEQARKTPGGIGPGVDIYALGSILYEMLTGRPPFQGETAAETIAQLLDEEPISPARLRPRLPRDIVTICLKCLEKSPRKRYASALDLAEDLRRFQAGEPIRARPVGIAERTVRWCRRRPVVAALLLFSTLLVVAFIGTVLFYEARLEEALLEARTAGEDERQQIVQLNVEIGLAAMQDGDRFTAVLRFTEALRLEEQFPDRQHDHRLRIADALRGCPRLLQVRTDPGAILCTRVNPDGGRLVEVGPDGQAHVCDLRTGDPIGVPLALPEAPLAGAISPDGRLLVTIRPGGTAMVWNRETGKAAELPSQGTPAIQRAAFHPDGRLLLTTHADGAIRFWDLMATPPVPALSGIALTSAALSDDGRWLLTLGAGEATRVWNVATGKAVAGPPVAAQAVAQAAVGAGGRRVAILGIDSGLRTWDVKAACWLGRPIHLRHRASHMIFAPDGERLVTLGGDRVVQVWQVETGEEVAASRQLDETIAQASFSPDGRLLVTTNGAGVVQVWDATKARSLTPPLRHGGVGASVACWAAGQPIIVVSRNGTLSVWELPAADAVQGELTPDRRPVAELVAQARALAGSRIDEMQQRQPLDREHLQAAWDSLPRSP
jgi:serine/threonine protein kinase/WD40 repeat protein